MVYTREMIVKLIAPRIDFYQQNVRKVLNGLDDVLEDMISNVDDDEEVIICLSKGIKLGFKVVPERERIDPNTKEPIICGPRVKPFTKWSYKFKEKIQKYYDEKKSDGK